MSKSVVNNLVQQSVKRMVSAYAPGVGRINFESEATTYAQLKKELVAKGYSLEGMRVTEGNTQLDLRSDDAILPTNIDRGERGITNDLVIIMTPQQKIKSGAIDVDTAPYKELKATIKELCNSESTKVAAKAHFGNYTQMSTPVMRSKLKEWFNSNKQSEKPSPKVKSETFVKVDTTKSKAKLEKVREELEEGNFESMNTPLDFNDTAYMEGVRMILVGVIKLQNEVFDTKEPEVVSDEDLQRMIKRAQ